MFGRDDFVFLNTNDVNCQVVRSSDILSIEADGNYAQVHLANAVIMIHRGLKKCESQLDSSIFFRTGRSCIVNLAHVRKVRKADSKRYMFVMADGRDIILSRVQSILFRRQKSL